MDTLPFGTTLDNCCILRAPSYVLRRTSIVVYYNNGFIIATIIVIAIITIIIYKDEQPLEVRC